MAALADGSAVYQLPYDPTIPTLCMDESGFALTADTRAPLPPRPAGVAKQDYQDSRHGRCVLFGAFEPHTGFRVITVMERRTRRAFARFVKTLLTEHFPDAIRVRLVLDNRNIHTPGALYETFPAAEARALAERMASREQVQAEASAWASARVVRRLRVDWRFTVADARVKMKHCYPIPTPCPDTA